MDDLNQISFACLATAGEMEKQVLLLARSIRTFAGRYASSPILVLIPQGTPELSHETLVELTDLEVHLVRFDVDPAVLAFPFGTKVIAAAAAESHATSQAGLLVWMDSDSIVIREPGALLIDENKALGYRPVDHTLIASRYADPLDDFWRLIYHECAVSDQSIFPMTTSVDRVQIRPYFNAGMLVVRPENGLLVQWANSFARLFLQPAFSVIFKQNQLYKIFFHQAVLAGIILSTLPHKAMQMLPYRVNYPLHMTASYPVEYRPTTMNELITCRYDIAFEEDEWPETIMIEEPLKSWLLHKS